MSEKENIDPLLTISFKCPIHKSEIGGVCGDFLCQNNIHMKCIKCVSDPNSCLKQKNHKFVSIIEFFDKFYNEEYFKLKTDYQTCKYVNNAENYARNTEILINTFNNKRENMLKNFEENFDKYIKEVNEFKENYINYYNNFMNEKIDKLKQSLLNINFITNYDTFEGFDENLLKFKMSKMPFKTLNDTFNEMKKTIINLQRNAHLEDTKLVENLINLKDEEIMNFSNKKFIDLNNILNNTLNELKEEINKKMYQSNLIKITPLENLKKICDTSIDYSTNSNFLDKKFCLYESDNKIFLAYPSSLHQIKIENFSENINRTEEILMHTSNEKLYLNTNVNQRDHLLYFKLCGHISKINDIKFYKDSLNNLEYLISSSDDHSIKIWNISNLNNYINKPEKYYENNINVKTLIGHKNKIKSMEIFFDKNTQNSLIFSLSENDKIKIWDLKTGELFKELYDRTSEIKGTFEDYILPIEINGINYLFTFNDEKKIIKIWNINQEIVINTIKYIHNSKIVQILYHNNLNKLFVFDKDSSCAVLEFNDGKVLQIKNMLLKNFDTERIGTFFWEDNLIIIYCKNGRIYEYNLDETRFIDKLRIIDGNISYMIKYYDNFNNRKLLICHCEDQHIKIYG